MRSWRGSRKKRRPRKKRKDSSLKDKWLSSKNLQNKEKSKRGLNEMLLVVSLLRN